MAPESCLHHSQWQCSDPVERWGRELDGEQWAGGVCHVSESSSHTSPGKAQHPPLQGKNYFKERPWNSPFKTIVLWIVMKEKTIVNWFGLSIFILFYHLLFCFLGNWCRHIVIQFNIQALTDFHNIQYFYNCICCTRRPWQAYQYGVYTRELLQFGDKLSMLLLLPPSEDFSSSYWPLVGTKELGLTMPLQIFELGRWRIVVHRYEICLTKVSCSDFQAGGKAMTLAGSV